MDSVSGQTFMNYAYSWGAAIVILGTLFKLTHLPGANAMLFIGMGTEVFVFFISAFDRPFDKTQEGRNLATDTELAAALAAQEALENGIEPTFPGCPFSGRSAGLPFPQPVRGLPGDIPRGYTAWTLRRRKSGGIPGSGVRAAHPSPALFYSTSKGSPCKWNRDLYAFRRPSHHYVRTGSAEDPPLKWLFPPDPRGLPPGNSGCSVR